MKRLALIAKIQSTEASNKIEGIVTTSARMKQLFEAKTTPRKRVYPNQASIYPSASSGSLKEGRILLWRTLAYVMVGCAPSMDFKSVCLDRPFVYAIMDTETRLPVFTGIYNQAKK